MTSRNKNAVLLFWNIETDTISGIGIGSHMTWDAVDERLPKAIESAEFQNREQQVHVYGSAALAGREILGVVGVELSPTPDPLELLRFMHALVGEVATMQTVDVVRIDESSSAESSVVNRIAMADVAAMTATIHQEWPA